MQRRPLEKGAISDGNSEEDPVQEGLWNEEGSPQGGGQGSSPQGGSQEDYEEDHQESRQVVRQ